MDYRFAPMEEVVATAMTIVPGATQEHQVLFRQWVWEAVKQIGPTTHWVKTCEIKAKNLSIPKPKDLASTLTIGLFDESGHEIHYTWQGYGDRVHIDRFQNHALLTREDATFRIDLSEDAYYFHIGTNGKSVAYAKLRYLALPIDSDSKLLIPEDNILACATFCRWMWAMRKGDNQSEIDLSRDTWYRERDRIYGDNKMPSVMQANHFAMNRYLSLINSFKPTAW
jgi:hypothetical protein